MAAAMPAAAALSAGLVEEGSERLSHKEVEQRRREKAKQYFDELRALLPCGADSKFDKNTILQVHPPPPLPALRSLCVWSQRGGAEGWGECAQRVGGAEG
eukprot:819717-Rhodomonas_salina.2